MSDIGAPANAMLNLKLPIEGWSTADIIRGLCAGQVLTENPVPEIIIPLRNIDAAVAQKHDKMSAIETLDENKKLIYDLIDKIPKEKAASKPDYMRENVTIEGEIDTLKNKLEKDVLPLYNQTKELIASLKTLVPDTNSYAEKGKEILQQLDALKAKKASYDQAVKIYEKEYNGLIAGQQLLHEKVARNAPRDVVTTLTHAPKTEPTTRLE